ncbi:MAG TPA: phage tail protein [Prosthecobacter sp.]
MNQPSPHPSHAASYPPVAFAFRLQMLGSASMDDEAGFQDVSGLGMEMETESYHEGGQNFHRHTLPNGVKGGTLVLKRGLVSLEKPLYRWCERILQGGLNSPITPASFNLQLLGARRDASAAGAEALSGDVLKAWTFLRAWPTKWSLSSFNATENQVVMETLELSYTTQVRMCSPPASAKANLASANPGALKQAEDAATSTPTLFF